MVVFVFVLCLLDSADCLVLVMCLLHRLSAGVPEWSAMVSKLRRGVRGPRVRSEMQKCW